MAAAVGGGALAGCALVGPSRPSPVPRTAGARRVAEPRSARRAVAPGAGSGLPVRFGAPRPLTAGPGLAAVACGAPTACIALDSAGAAFRYDGTTWAGPVEPAGPRTGPGAVTVSCASATSCVAATTGGADVERWDGQGWSAPEALPGAHSVEAVGCAPSGYCAAVDGEGNAFASAGSGWQRTSGDWGAASAVSCLSATWCMSSSGGVSHWDGSQWTVPDTLGASSSFVGVSCAATTMCMAVDQRGDAWQWDGTSWLGPTRIEPRRLAGSVGGPSPTGVSCPTTSFCVVVDDTGAVLEWAHGRWARTVVDTGSGLTAVSCSTATSCVVVDGRGDVLVGGG